MNRLFESIFLLLQTVKNGIGRIPLKFAGPLAKNVCGGKIAMQRSADDQTAFSFDTRRSDSTVNIRALSMSIIQYLNVQ